MTSVIGARSIGCCKITPATETTLVGFLKAENGLVTGESDPFVNAEELNALTDRVEALETEDNIPAAGSSTDNALARWDGAGGNALQDSAVIVSDAGEISGYLEKQITVAGTSYAIDNTVPSGCVLRFTSGSAVTVTIDSALAAGWNCSARQMGAGVVTFTGVHNRSGHTDTAGQYAWVALACDSNADGSSAVVVLGGDTA